MRIIQTSSLKTAKSDFRIESEFNPKLKSGSMRAFLGPKKIAWLTYYVKSHDLSQAHISLIETEPEYRGRGVARRLLQEFVNKIKKDLPFVESVSAEYMASKSLHLANEVLGDPEVLELYNPKGEDQPVSTEQAKEALPPDAFEDEEGLMNGPYVNGRHPIPRRRIPKKELRPFKPYHSQPELPFSDKVAAVKRLRVIRNGLEFKAMLGNEQVGQATQ